MRVDPRGRDSAEIAAAKIEETPKKARDLLNVYNNMHQRRDRQKLEPLDITTNRYIKSKQDLVDYERHILKEMGFSMAVEHPHKFLLSMTKSVLEVQSTEFLCTSWNFVNDSLRTPMCVRYKPEVIASAAIYLAGRQHNIPLPENPPWWELFNTEKDDILRIVHTIRELYGRPKAAYINVLKPKKKRSPPPKLAPPTEPKTDAKPDDSDVNGKDDKPDALTKPNKNIRPPAKFDPSEDEVTDDQAESKDDGERKRTSGSSGDDGERKRPPPPPGKEDNDKKAKRTESGTKARDDADRRRGRDDGRREDRDRSRRSRSREYDDSPRGRDRDRDSSPRKARSDRDRSRSRDRDDRGYDRDRERSDRRRDRDYDDRDRDRRDRGRDDRDRDRRDRKR